jgi:hypothetical protein
MARPRPRRLAFKSWSPYQPAARFWTNRHEPHNQSRQSRRRLRPQHPWKLVPLHPHARVATSVILPRHLNLQTYKTARWASAGELSRACDRLRRDGRKLCTARGKSSLLGSLMKSARHPEGKTGAVNTADFTSPLPPHFGFRQPATPARVIKQQRYADSTSTSIRWRVVTATRHSTQSFAAVLKLARCRTRARSARDRDLLFDYTGPASIT